MFIRTYYNNSFRDLGKDCPLFSLKDPQAFLVFSLGILYNKEKGTYRTEKINPLFAEIKLSLMLRNAPIKKLKQRSNIYSHLVNRSDQPFSGSHVMGPFETNESPAHTYFIG